MPTYDYACDACEHTLEVFQSFSESPKKKCPQCGKLQLRRVISGGVGLVFKGSGFYITDSRQASKSPVEKNPSGTSTEAHTSADAKTSKDSSSTDSAGATTTSSAASDKKPSDTHAKTKAKKHKETQKISVTS